MTTFAITWTTDAGPVLTKSWAVTDADFVKMLQAYSTTLNQLVPPGQPGLTTNAQLFGGLAAMLVREIHDFTKAQQHQAAVAAVVDPAAPTLTAQ